MVLANCSTSNACSASISRRVPWTAISSQSGFGSPGISQ
jgi:hypothetical protein